jgi:hypothetical protein
MGTSAATQPTPNKGYEMAGIQRLGVFVKNLEQIIPLVGSSSPIGQDVLKALQMLSKHIPPGTVTPAGEQNQIQSMAMRNSQNTAQAAQMRQQQAQPQGGAPQAPAQAA